MEKSSRKPKRPVALDVVLPHPARTPMPAELRRGLAPARRPSEVGQRRAKGLQSGYVATSPTSARLDRQSMREPAIRVLLEARRAVLGGASLMQALPGGLEGWHARQAVADAIGTVRVPQWDEDPRRTQAERRAVLDKALELAGYVRRGGWTVTR